MNYIIFDSDIYYDSDGKTGIIPKDKIGSLLGPNQEFSVAIIDTLQKQVAAPEKSASRKDEVIASSFTGDYVTQSERIAPNLFQVIAVEKPKAAEIYKLLGFEKIRQVVPYGIALREFLKANNILSGSKTVVFLDHMSNQVLLTIFSNDVFTTPRRLSVAVKRVVSELDRSQKNYKELNKDKAEISFLIVTNSKEIADEVVSEGIDVKENVVLLPEAFPALSGLKQGKFSMHYMLPEHFIRLRRIKQAKRQVFNLGIMLGVLGFFLTLFLGSLNENKTASLCLKNLRLEEASQNEALRSVYAQKYKDMLREKQRINFAYFFGVFFKALPYECRVESISIRSVPYGRYRFEAIVYQEAKDRPLAGFFLPRVFKQARIENILVKANPGLRISAEIF